MGKRDFYEVLGVSRSCDEKELKGAFRRLAMQYHPDRNGGDGSFEAKFKEVNEAYEILKDPNKRAAYDRYGHQAFQNGGPQPSGFSSFADIFDEFFGDLRGSRRSGRERGSDLRYNLEITLEDAFAGKTVEVEVPTSVTCDVCTGTGSKPGTMPKACPTCGGIGRVRASQGGFFHIERTCPACHGRGEVVADPCVRCAGAGRVSQTRTLSVNIPAGIEDGTRIRLGGEGEAGLRGGPAGDLYIFLSLKPHPFFQRDGADIYCRVPVSFTTAALGGQFEVPTIDGGRTRVKVPEGAQTGRQFRLKSKGMPVMRTRQVGDMYVQILVETPQNLSRRQRELLQEFEQASNGENSPESAGFFARVKDFFETLGEK